jgi:hypothetical protein
MSEDKLFYDDLESGLEKKIWRSEKENKEVDPLAFFLLKSIKDSHIILTDSIIVDSLYNVPNEKTDYWALEHMPYFNIFFELTSPMNVVDIEKESGLVRAIQLGKLVETSPEIMKDIFDSQSQGKPRGYSEDAFVINIYYQSGNRLSIPFSPKEDREELESGKPRINTFQQEVGDKQKELCVNMVRFCHNLVSYINANNATEITVERDNTKLKRVNKRKQKKGERTLPEKKPYSWIDIKPARSYSRSGHESGTELNYRMVVIGHWQRYHTTEGIVRNWKDPFVIGPEDAPWKDSRHRLRASLLMKKQSYKVA